MRGMRLAHRLSARTGTGTLADPTVAVATQNFEASNAAVQAARKQVRALAHTRIRGAPRCATRALTFAHSHGLRAALCVHAHPLGTLILHVHMLFDARWEPAMRVHTDAGTLLHVRAWSLHSWKRWRIMCRGG